MNQVDFANSSTQSRLAFPVSLIQVGTLDGLWLNLWTTLLVPCISQTSGKATWGERLSYSYLLTKWLSLYLVIRWQQNGTAFGWSIEQYQAWARGTLKITKQSSILIQLHNVATFYIDEKRYSGDLYGYNTTLHWVELEKGTHTLETRLVHDVRVFGGGNNKGPQCKFSISIYPLDGSTMVDDTLFSYRHRLNNTATTTLLAREMIKDVLVPSFIQNVGFAGKYGSVSIHNLTMDSLQVVSIRLVFQAYSDHNHTSDVVTILVRTGDSYSHDNYPPLLMLLLW